MSDKSALAKIEHLTVDEYKAAFVVVREQMAVSDLLLLKAHYEFPNCDITATQLSRKVSFINYHSANLRYGKLAGKFCDFFQIHPDLKLSVLVNFEWKNNEWHWILLPKVVKTLDKLRWFDKNLRLNILQEIERYKDSYDNLQATSRESVIQSRIGQGQFRDMLVEYWLGCSVSGCKYVETLRASHIKPWRFSSNKERLDVYNGLLLLPNIDACFDLGLISFKDDGKILISSELNSSVLLQMGINSKLRLSRVEPRHKKYLHFHREKIFRR
jgi:hypothetical protein